MSKARARWSRYMWFWRSNVSPHDFRVQVCKVEFSSQEALDQAITFQTEEKTRFKVQKLKHISMDEIHRDHGNAPVDYYIAGSWSSQKLFWTVFIIWICSLLSQRKKRFPMQSFLDPLAPFQTLKNCSKCATVCSRCATVCLCEKAAAIWGCLHASFFRNNFRAMLFSTYATPPQHPNLISNHSRFVVPKHCEPYKQSACMRTRQNEKRLTIACRFRLKILKRRGMSWSASSRSRLPARMHRIFARHSPLSRTSRMRRKYLRLPVKVGSNLKTSPSHSLR